MRPTNGVNAIYHTNLRFIPLVEGHLFLNKRAESFSVSAASAHAKLINIFVGCED